MTVLHLSPCICGAAAVCGIDPGSPFFYVWCTGCRKRTFRTASSFVACEAWNEEMARIKAEREHVLINS